MGMYRLVGSRACRLLTYAFVVEAIGLEVTPSHLHQTHKHHHQVSPLHHHHAAGHQHLAHHASPSHHKPASHHQHHDQNEEPGQHQLMHHQKRQQTPHHHPAPARLAARQKSGLRGLRRHPRVQKAHHHHSEPVPSHHHKNLYHNLFAAESSKTGSGLKCYESETEDMGDLKDCSGDDAKCMVRYREDADGVKTYFHRYCTIASACKDHEGNEYIGDAFKSFEEQGGTVFYKCCDTEGCNGNVPATIPGLPGEFYILDKDGKYLGLDAKGSIVKQDNGYQVNQKFTISKSGGQVEGGSSEDGGYSISLKLGQETLSVPGVDSWKISRIGVSSYAIHGVGAGGPESLNGESEFSLMPATSWDVVKEGKTCKTRTDVGSKTLAECTAACDSDSNCVGAVAWPTDAFNSELCDSPMKCQCSLITATCDEDQEEANADWNVYAHKCAGVTCFALDQCHAVGVCNRADGTCNNPEKDDGVGCNDNDENTVEDVCTAGVCAGTNYCADVVCSAKNQCYDTGVCNINDGTCSEPMKSIGTACDDGLATTVSDQCVSGECKGTDRCEGVTCSQLDQCHVVGECDSYTGLCTNPKASVGTTCDDGVQTTVEDACTVEATCVGVDKCQDVTCSAKDQCHVGGVCDYKTGECSDPFKPEGSECDDGNEITMFDQCDGEGTCAGRDLCAGVTCRSMGTCFSEGICNYESGSCEYDQKAEGDPCDDSNHLTIEDKCDADGACAGKGRCEDVTCTALEPLCHMVGLCDPETGTCSNPTKDDGTVCNDGNQITLNDQCTAGVCAGEELCADVTCDSPGECQEAGICNWQTGECEYPTAPDSTQCDDGADNTVEDQCTAGKCSGMDKCKDVSCPAASDCHNEGTCDKHTGACSTEFKAQGESCNDGSGYTKNDQCDGHGVCVGEKLCVGVVCEAEDQCHDVGICNDLNGECSNPVKAHGSSCDDENEKSVRDICDVTADSTGAVQVECKGEDLCADVSCTALDQCHEAGECNYADGSCSNPQASDGTECDDQNPFTNKDSCTLGSCAGEQIIHCEHKGIGVTRAQGTENSAANDFKENVDFACAVGEVLSSLKITPFNSHEDRQLQFGCSPVATGTEQCVYTPATVPNQDFSQSCESGYAVAGVEATYTESVDGTEDRVYKFLCCKITSSVKVVDADTAVACDNQGDGDSCNVAGVVASFSLSDGVAVTKVESAFDSLRVDRVWTFYTSGFEEEVCSECKDISCLPAAGGD